MDNKKSSILSSARSGFTLIELLVVVAVVGVLAGAVIAIINPSAQISRAHDAQRKQDIRTIANALERYAVDYGHYPIVAAWVYSTAGDAWISELSPSYLKRVPKDTINNGQPWYETQAYSYAYRSDTGIHYNLVAKLENAQDPDRCEIKKWIYITNYTTGAGMIWCPTYGNRIYSTTDLNN